jgi:hypothetical protein
MHSTTKACAKACSDALGCGMGLLQGVLKNINIVFHKRCFAVAQIELPDVHKALVKA